MESVKSTIQGLVDDIVNMNVRQLLLQGVNLGALLFHMAKLVGL